MKEKQLRDSLDEFKLPKVSTKQHINLPNKLGSGYLQNHSAYEESKLLNHDSVIRPRLKFENESRFLSVPSREKDLDD